MKRFLLILSLASLAATARCETTAYPSLKPGDTSGWGRNIQRTMRLLATCTPEHRNTVRILFYGQSITEQKWAQFVTEDLRTRFPNADLVIENRALAGFASQMLVKTAETDLYPFQPDLLIFYVYGAHDKYEDIILRTRERTTAEILMQNDHVTKSEAFTEETDPAKLWPPDGKRWDAFMNHRWLPMLQKKYGTELCDQRALWKVYLKENNLEPKALLRDGVHLNPHGEFLMAECVKAYLRYDPKLGPSPAEQWVKEYEVGKDGRLEFEGSRVDVIAKPGEKLGVKIDGKKPSEIPALYGFSRAKPKPGGKWPPVAPIKSEKPLVLEDWTMDVTKTGEKLFDFTVAGSKTGPDGSGRSDQKFVSDSGRVVIEPDAWNVDFAMSVLAGVKPIPAKFTVTWNVVPHFADEATGGTVTVANGLPNTKHVLELTAPATVRVYTPPLKGSGDVR